jgi:ABC-type branched-subunit amino acid transport system substrate-binding protein
MSVTQVADMPPSSPVATARGVIVAQSVPYPFAGVLPVVREYQKAMKERAPGRPFDYFTLEGYIGAKIAHQALKRAGKKPTRQSFLAALKTLGEVDLGGVTVNYSEKARLGWEGVDLTIIGQNGNLQR